MVGGLPADDAVTDRRSSQSFIAPPKCPACNGAKCERCEYVGHVSLEQHQAMLFELAKDGIEINVHDTPVPPTEPDPKVPA